MLTEIMGRRKGAVTLIGPTFLVAPPFGRGSEYANWGFVEAMLETEDDELWRLTDPVEPLATS